MAESATYISQLDADAPAANAQVSDGDDQLRLIKTVLKSQFPNLGEASITVTAAVINRLAGLSGNIVDLLAAKAPLDSPLLTGNARAPTPNVADSSTKIATTEFVNAIAMSGVPPEMAGTLNELREALMALPDFGTAAERDVGTGTGDVMEVGAGGWLADAFPAYAGDLNDIAVTCITLVGPAATNAPHPGEYSFVLTLSAGSSGRAQFALCVSDSAGPQWRASATDGTGYGGWAALGGGGGGGSIVSLASTFNGAVSLDVQAVQYPYGALTGNSTFAFTNIPASNYWEWRIEIANPGTRTWTFPTHSNLYWQGYTAKPPLRETGVTALQFWVRDYGTTNKIFARVLWWGATV